jgi:predicted DNA-binding transcriptional regulator YafY
MRRADRLFQLVQLIRGRRLSTAAWLALRLEVSVRSVYRDIADLQHQGVPIEGEAGVGYRLGKGFELPPLMFTQDEAKTLVAAMRLAQPWLDAALAAQAESALGKVLSVLPPAARVAAESMAVYSAAPAGLPVEAQQVLQTLREAIAGKRKLQLTYRDLKDQTSQRTVRPLACLYWGQVWTLAAWCEQRRDFRSFRIDRISSPAWVDSFHDEPGKALSYFLRQARKPGTSA